MNIEHLNSLITAKAYLKPQEAKATSRINKELIETIRDYLTYHDLDYKSMVEKQLKQTSKYCKTVKA